MRPIDHVDNVFHLQVRRFSRTYTDHLRSPGQNHIPDDLAGLQHQPDTVRSHTYLSECRYLGVEPIWKQEAVSH